MKGEKFWQKGFTLLEAVIALGFFALLACTALSLLQLGTSCFSYSDEKAGVQYELRAAQERIVQDVRESQFLKDRPVTVVNEKRMVIEKLEDINGTSTRVKITYMLNSEGQLVRQINRLDNGSLVSAMPLTDIKVVPVFKEAGNPASYYYIKLEGVNSRGDRILQMVVTGLGRRVE